MYRRYIKRPLDIFGSAVALVILAFPMLVIALAIKIDSPGPVVFKQKRLGLGGKEFVMYKFRTMCVNAESGGVYCAKGDSRITRVGRILRATSLDELVQLWNVLKGDMSFIGPRPPLTYHPWPFEEYTDEQKRMFEVRPGLTGWAQVHGRKEVEWNQRIQLNVYYVDHVSAKTDLLICFRSIWVIIRNTDNENSTETAKSAQELHMAETEIEAEAVKK